MLVVVAILLFITFYNFDCHCCILRGLGKEEDFLWFWLGNAHVT